MDWEREQTLRQAAHEPFGKAFMSNAPMQTGDRHPEALNIGSFLPSFAVCLPCASLFSQ